LENNHKFVGCILIGGKSSRMGTPKHLLKHHGKAWLTCISSILAGYCDEIVIAGNGELPEGSWRRLADAAECKGPMAGILAAMREYPQDTIIVCACDMPEISKDAIAWLISQQQPDDWAVIPKIKDQLQPLFALYDPRLIPVLEDLSRRNILKMKTVCANPQVRVVSPPSTLYDAWSNINDPRELQKWHDHQGVG
jgi:molybdopterin-guanine dinucleotide biosynthesis protein A